MGYKNTLKNTHSEEKLQEAMVAIKNNKFTSIRSAASHFKVAKSTLSDRLAGAQSRSDANKSHQILSSAKEATLVNSITRLIATGC